MGEAATCLILGWTTGKQIWWCEKNWNGSVPVWGSYKGM